VNCNLFVPGAVLGILRLNDIGVSLVALAGLIAVIATIVWASCHPRSTLFGSVRWRGGDTARKRIALTFDDGPTPGATDRVLDLLAELNVPAAFFVIGLNAQRSPELVARMHEQGHLIGNHSFDHSHVGYLRSGKYWDRQLADTDRAVREIIGRKPTLFRPPIGIRTPRLMMALRRSRHILVTWSRRGLDGVHRSPEYIRERLVNRTRPGDILVLHDGVPPGRDRDSAATLAAIPMVVRGLRERGFEFVRLDDLLETEPAMVQDTIDKDAQDGQK
jgi:peptidoglycan/xylan/chitin deacetylase (PgdA/CDA1 family)